jgi:hypothetical protein
MLSQARYSLPIGAYKLDWHCLQIHAIQERGEGRRSTNIHIPWQMSQCRIPCTTCLFTSIEMHWLMTLRHRLQRKPTRRFYMYRITLLNCGIWKCTLLESALVKSACMNKWMGLSWIVLGRLGTSWDVLDLPPQQEALSSVAKISVAGQKRWML